jgi:fructose-bisphosphate aldolase class II
MLLRPLPRSSSLDNARDLIIRLAYRDIRLAMTGAMRRSMALHRAEFDPRKFLKDATAAARDICRERYEAFGCAGQASKIKPIPLEEMAQHYVAGELSPTVRAKIAA